MKKLLLTAAIAIGMASTAHAGSIASTIDFTKDFNSWEDQSGEFAISGFDANGNPIPVTTGDLKVGDMFVGLLDIENVDSTPVGGGTTNNELTALFITKITSMGAEGTDGRADFTFGAASATAWANITGLDVTNINGSGMDVSGGVMALLFEDSKNNVDFSSIPGGLATTLDGNLRAAIGLDNSGATGWDATAPVTIGDFSAPGTFFGDEMGSFIFNLNALYENFGFDFARTLPSQFGNGYTDFRVANGTVSVPEQGFGFPVQDNATIFFSAIPEPAGLGLMGLGLLGVSLLARRRRS